MFVGLLLSALLFQSFNAFTEGVSVNVSSYIEALCPYCRRYIRERFYPAYQALGSAYINAEFIPYGNAQLDATGVVTCQHGENECYGNKVYACSLTQFPIENNVEFIYCGFEFETLNDTVFSQCAQKANITWDTVNACVNNSTRADQLITDYGELTQQAKIGGTPWVLYNNTASSDGSPDDDTNFGYDFLFHVCKWLNYEPEACQ